MSAVIVLVCRSSLLATDAKARSAMSARKTCLMASLIINLDLPFRDLFCVTRDQFAIVAHIGSCPASV
jgi:hypothetical protein